jgi:uncharacterized membrane protein YhaH (DUF805 family)
MKRLWSFEGTMDRGPYLAIGLIGFAIKHNLDRLIAIQFGRSWDIFNYWAMPESEGIDRLGDQTPFVLTLLVASLPFIWVGLAQTLKRLRAIGWPPILLVLFFAPFLNLLFFLLLSVIPSREAEGRSARPGVNESSKRARLAAIVPRRRWGAAIAGALVTSLLAIPTAVVLTHVAGNYGWSLFVGLPFVMGLLTVMLFTYHERRSLIECLAAAGLSVVVISLLLFALALEGLICIAMAAPLAAVLACVGGWVGYLLQSHPRRVAAGVYPALLLVLPAAFLLESAVDREPPVFEVVTAIEVNAPPQEVWRQLIAFGEMAAPKEWIFRLGIAYPIRAEIHGSGPGAVRHCVFSTGAFVEPITVWDEARRLRFSVAANPPPMQEWTPYDDLDPPHLKGFLESTGGQFLLTPLAGGRTRLEGTTWYRHSLWPASYWKLISDQIIHRIHLRVLCHIQSQSEATRK